MQCSMSDPRLEDILDDKLEDMNGDMVSILDSWESQLNSFEEDPNKKLKEIIDIMKGIKISVTSKQKSRKL